MALQLGALRNALLEAGASSDKAEAAAEELVSYDGRFTSTDLKVVRLAGSVQLVQWMAATSLVLIMLVLGSVVALWIKFSELEGQFAAVSSQLAAVAKAVSH